MTLANQLHTARPHGNTKYGTDLISEQLTNPSENKMTSFVSVSVLGVLFFSCLLDQGNTAVISIDFSSEWIKIALVKV